MVTVYPGLKVKLSHQYCNSLKLKKNIYLWGIFLPPFEDNFDDLDLTDSRLEDYSRLIT